MAVTATNIKDCFPEFGQLPDTLVDKYRLQAERRINLVQWGEKADDGILWLTAHLLKLYQQIKAGAFAKAGPISEKKVGDLSIKFAIPGTLKHSWLSSTTYGQYFQDLKTGVWPTRVLA